MDWLRLSGEGSVEQLTALSKDNPVFIFKHSLSCLTSILVLKHVEKDFLAKKISFSPFLVDALKEKSISAAIADKWKIRHESPQVLIIQDGNCVYHASHSSILLKEYPHLAQLTI